MVLIQLGFLAIFFAGIFYSMIKLVHILFRFFQEFNFLFICEILKEHMLTIQCLKNFNTIQLGNSLILLKSFYQNEGLNCIKKLLSKFRLILILLTKYSRIKKIIVIALLLSSVLSFKSNVLAQNTDFNTTTSVYEQLDNNKNAFQFKIYD
jgi:hypothetical protein